YLRRHLGGVPQHDRPARIGPGTAELFAAEVLRLRQLGDNVGAGGVETEEPLDRPALRWRVQVTPRHVLDLRTAHDRRPICGVPLVVAVGRGLRLSQKLGAYVRGI